MELLLGQQCADGGFRSEIDVQTCVSDPDTTAFAVQALLARATPPLPRRQGSADAAARREGTGPPRSGSGGRALASDGIANANTTAVAAQAFAAGGRTALDAAQAFLVSLQYGGSSPWPSGAGWPSARTRGRPRRWPTATSGPRRRGRWASPASRSSALAPDVEGAAPGDTCPPTSTRRPSSRPRVLEPGSTVDRRRPRAPGPVGRTRRRRDPGPTGSLAQTGSDLLAPVGLGLLLVVVGGVAVAISRRKGAHA